MPYPSAVRSGAFSRPALRSTLRPLAASLLLALAGTAVQAASVFNLRAMDAQADWTTVPDNATIRFEDRFNNHDALTVGAGAGAGYSGGPVTPTPLYTPTGSFAGTETTPGDFHPNGTDFGQLQFSAASGLRRDITVNGIAYDDRTHRLLVNDPLATKPLLDSSRTNFSIHSGWEFLRPDAGARYGMRMTDNMGGGFNDTITLDVVPLFDGSGGVQMRRLSGDGLGNFVATEIQTRSFASAFAPGFDFSRVDLVSRHMYWYADTQQVQGEVEFHHIAADGNSGSTLGTLTFGQQYTIFHGESVTRMQVGASWSAAQVPESSTWAMLLAGLGGVAATMRRRRT